MSRMSRGSLALALVPLIVMGLLLVSCSQAQQQADVVKGRVYSGIEATKQVGQDVVNTLSGATKTVQEQIDKLQN